MCFNDTKFGIVRHNRIESWLGVCKEYYAKYYVQKSSILFAENGAVKISSVACGFSPVQIHYSDYPKSVISRINEVYFFHKISI